MLNKHRFNFFFLVWDGNNFLRNFHRTENLFQPRLIGKRNVGLIPHPLKWVEASHELSLWVQFVDLELFRAMGEVSVWCRDSGSAHQTDTSALPHSFLTRKSKWSKMKLVEVSCGHLLLLRNYWLSSARKGSLLPTPIPSSSLNRRLGFHRNGA